MTTALTGDLERRKLVRLRVRADLGITPSKYEGKTHYVVKDPVSLRYYRFNEQEYFVVKHFDGKHTLEETQKAFEREFRPHRLTLEDLEGFAQQLLQAGLVQHETAQAGKQLYEKRRKQRRLQRIATISNILYIKLPVFDPDKLLGRMLKYRPWIFTYWFFAASVGLDAVGRDPGDDPLRDVLAAAAELPGVLHLQPLALPLDRARDREGDPRVRARAELQSVRRRMPRDGGIVLVSFAVPVLQRLRLVDAAEQVAADHHQLRRHLRRAGDRRAIATWVWWNTPDGSVTSNIVAVRDGALLRQHVRLQRQPADAVRRLLHPGRLAGNPQPARPVQPVAEKHHLRILPGHGGPAGAVHGDLAEGAVRQPTPSPATSTAGS